MKYTIKNVYALVTFISLSFLEDLQFWISSFGVVRSLEVHRRHFPNDHFGGGEDRHVAHHVSTDDLAVLVSEGDMEMTFTRGQRARQREDLEVLVVGLNLLGKAKITNRKEL
jgi:hypothetical protein